MENVLLTGFDDEKAPSNDESVPLMVYAKLAGLGSGKICQQHLMHKLIKISVVMTPNRGELTSITYRSPEVYFNKPWTSAIDIPGE